MQKSKGVLNGYFSKISNHIWDSKYEKDFGQRPAQWFMSFATVFEDLKVKNSKNLEQLCSKLLS